MYVHLVLKAGPNDSFLQQVKCITAMCPKILLAIKNWMVVRMARNEASFFYPYLDVLR